MGEANRKAQRQPGRPWMTGSIKIVANDEDCFEWSGTRQDAVDLQRKYLNTVEGTGQDAHSYAARAAGYLMAFGMPKVGSPRLNPTGFGEPWDKDDVELYRSAVLWLGLREHVPGSGEKVEDFFVGKGMVVMFIGDKKLILEETDREMRGMPFTGGQFQMGVGILNEQLLLDPRDAVSMRESDLVALATGSRPKALGDDMIFVPRIPRDAAEADAMLRTLTIFADTTAPGAETPEDAIRHYAGYTDSELMRGRPGLRVK
jgi:hypothetical protein